MKVCIRLEATDDGEVVWWADAPDLPGLYVAADSLNELLIRSHMAVVELAGPDQNIEPLLIPSESVSVGSIAAAIESEQAAQASEGPEIRSQQVERNLERIPA